MAVIGRHGYSSWRKTPRPSVWSWSEPTPSAVIALPLFLGLGLGGNGIRLIALHASAWSVVGGLLFVIAGLVPLAGLAAYLSRPLR